MVYVKMALKNMIKDTDLMFRDPYLDHNNSQAQKVQVFLNSMCVYTYICMLHLIDLFHFYNPRCQHI